MSLAHALKWSFLSELSAKLLAPAVFIILARLLTPEDFGVVAVAMMVIGFSQIFWEAGMSKAIIQYRGDRATAADVAFWINCGLACVVAAILIVTAEALAGSVFHDPQVAPVLQVMALQVLLSAVVSVHTALLQKDMQFKPLFWVRLTTVAIPGLISIPLAWQGKGYWALIAGILAGQLVQVAMLWRMSPWRPRWAFDIRVARTLGGFGAWVGLSGLLAWFYVWADSLIVGIYLGSGELGLFRTGNQFAMMIFAIPFGPILPVLFSHFSRLGQSKEELEHLIEKTVKVLILLSIPIALIIFSLSDTIAAALFGDDWKGIGPIIGIMALAHGFSWVIGMNGEAYRAMGQPRYETLAIAATLPVYLVAYIVSIRHGLDTFIWTRLLLTLFCGLLLQFVVLRVVLLTSLVPITGFIAKILIIAAGIVTAVHYFIQSLTMSAWWQLMVGGAMNLILVGAAIFWLERTGLLRDIVTLLKSRQI